MKTIFFCSCAIFLLNFPMVGMFIGRAAPYLYWGSIVAIMILSFREIIKQ